MQGTHKKIKPSFDIDTVRTEIAKTDDAFTLSSKFGTPKFYNIKDICFGAKGHSKAHHCR